MSGDPTPSARDWEERAILYVDGGLTPEEASRLERELAESAELRRAVAHARTLRQLVAGLPRPSCPLPAEPEEFLDARAADRLEVTANATEQGLLSGLRRVEAPAELWDRIETTVRAEADPAARAAAPSAPRRLRLGWRHVAAAAVVMGGLAAGLYFTLLSNEPVSEAPRQLQFVFVYEPNILDGSSEPGGPR